MKLSPRERILIEIALGERIKVLESLEYLPDRDRKLKRYRKLWKKFSGLPWREDVIPQKSVVD